MKKILVVGSLNMDLVTRVKATPQVGETVLGNGFDQIPGGKGANQAVAMGKLGGQVAMLGCVGDDEFGVALKSNLKACHVEDERVKVIKDSPTGLAMIMVNESGDNSIVVVPGANYELRPTDLSKSDFVRFEYCVAQLETPVETIERAFVLAKEAGVKTVLNPAPAQDLREKLIAHTDILIPNETEFFALTGYDTQCRDSLLKGAEVLYEKGVQALLITLGAQGAIYLDKEGTEIKKAGHKVDAVDTTAAGDSFIGGFVTALAEGSDVASAMEFAMKVAALTVTRHGAQRSLPNRQEVEGFEGVV